MSSVVRALCAVVTGLLAGCAQGDFAQAWLKANCERSQPCQMTCPDGSPASHGPATCIRKVPGGT